MEDMQSFMIKLLDPNIYSEQEKINGAQVMVKSCMNVQRGEMVLLIVQNDEKRRILGKYMEAEVRNLGAVPTLVMVEPDEMLHEPPQRVVDKMMRNDVITGRNRSDLQRERPQM